MTGAILTEYYQQLISMANKIVGGLRNKKKLPKSCSGFSVKRSNNGLEVLMKIIKRQNSRYFGKFAITLIYNISESNGIVWYKTRRVLKSIQEECSLVIKSDGKTIARKSFVSRGHGDNNGNFNPSVFKTLFKQLQILLGKKYSCTFGL